MIWRVACGLMEEMILHSGAHGGSFPIFRSKAAVIPLKLGQVRTPAANILKQEMLALGGDAITPMSTILGTEKYVDVLLLGTERQYGQLLLKLEQMPFFGLSAWKEQVEKILRREPVHTLLTNGASLDYSHTLLMGIVNLTPDSFYKESRVLRENLLNRVQDMLAQGADIIDLGAESTRPGAKVLDEGEEQARLLPALQLLREHFPHLVISVDTYHPGTGAAALEAGGDIINDVSGRDDVRMLEVVSRYNAPWIIIHNGSGDIFSVAANLWERSEKLGLPKEKIIWDPGIGFGKTMDENLSLLRNTGMLTCYGYPVLLGASRKSVIGEVLNLPAEERLEGTLAVSAHGVEQGVQMLRVHDVRENFRVVRMAEALKNIN